MSKVLTSTAAESDLGGRQDAAVITLLIGGRDQGPEIEIEPGGPGRRHVIAAVVRGRRRANALSVVPIAAGALARNEPGLGRCKFFDCIFRLLAQVKGCFSALRWPKINIAEA